MPNYQIWLPLVLGFLTLLDRIPRRIFPISPAAVVHEQCVIDVLTIGKEHISKGALGPV